MRSRRGCGALIALMSFAVASGAAAQGAPEVALEVPDCLGVKGEEVEKLAALELEPRMRVVGSATASALVGRVRCGDGGRVELRIERDRRHRPSSRRNTLAHHTLPATAARKARPATAIGTQVSTPCARQRSCRKMSAIMATSSAPLTGSVAPRR